MRRHAVVVGAGTMGAGIALLLAARGLTVHLASRSPESIARAGARLRAATGFLAAEGWLPSGSADTALAAIQPTTDIDDALARADLVLEAVTEDAAIKREAYRRIGERAPRSALVASTTSGLDVFAIAEGFPAPERLIIAHFWNPPYLVALVEVVPGAATCLGMYTRHARPLRARLHRRPAQLGALSRGARSHRAGGDRRRRDRRRDAREHRAPVPRPRRHGRGRLRWPRHVLARVGADVPRDQRGARGAGERPAGRGRRSVRAQERAGLLRVPRPPR